MDEEVYTVAGIRKVDFQDKEGKAVRGETIFLSKPIDAKMGTGIEFEKAFFSTDRLAAMAYKPAAGDQVEAFYNRRGKIYLLRLALTID